MVAFQISEEVRVEKKEEKIAEKVDEGKMSFEQAATKMEKIERPENQVGATTFKTIRKVIIKDATKLPREYLIPDEAKIRRDALAGIEIAGVEVIEEKIVASK